VKREDPEETRTDQTRPVSPRANTGEAPSLRLPPRYELGARLGKGGFGTVFAARDRLIGRDVAVKVLAAERSSTLLARETGALRLLDLPGVVRLLDSGSSDGAPWFVMERIEGVPFPDGNERVPWESLGPTVIELLRALGRIHRAGFVHGDLKPSNLLVRPDGVPVILDLGLAHSPAAGARAPLGGTPLYMAPEQIAGRGAVAASDLYAVGLMLWRALTGRWPHGDLGFGRGVMAHMDQDFPPITESGVLVPPAVEALIVDMLAREPARRPPSALVCVERLVPEEARNVLKWDPESPADLARLFLGHERLFHIPSAAASLLWERCDGDPVGVRSTLSTWILLGVASRENEGVHISLDTLERLIAGWAPEIEVGSSGAVAGAIPESPLARCLALASSEAGSMAASALVLAREERARGNLRGASVCLIEGLRACWRTEDFAHEGALVAAVTDLALADRSLGALDEAIDLIGRGRVHAGRELELLRAARALQDGRRDVAMAILEEERPNDPLDLQRARHDLRVQALVNGQLDYDRLATLEQELERWVSSAGSDEQPHLYRWRARIRYRQGRMRDAGMSAERAAAIEPAPFDRLGALLYAANAWIEAADVERTVSLAHCARALAADLRVSRLEARAEWLLRNVLNRQGATTEPDRELIDASCALRSPHVEGLIHATEAAIGWRCGRSEAGALAARARTAFEFAGYIEAVWYARALEIACGAGDEEESASLAIGVCAARRPDVAVEVLGLLAMSGRLTGDWRDAFEEQVRKLPNVDPSWRSGALSINEARRAVESASRSIE
jgi:tetratricopeptide (TPR) repeat protein